MNSTPHVPESGNQDCSAEQDGYWKSERLEDGTERHWTDLGRAYSRRQGDRARLTEAIAEIRWYRDDDTVPFSPGMLLQEIVRVSGVPAMAVGISGLPVDFPEPDLLDHDRSELAPWQYQTCSIVAVCCRCPRGILVTHFLDLGLEAVPVAQDMRGTAPLEDRTIACAAGLHRACRGDLTDEGKRQPCRCECGCATKQTGTA